MGLLIRDGDVTKTAVGIVIAIWCGIIAFWCGVGYIVVHFVHKYW